MKTIIASVIAIALFIITSAKPSLAQQTTAATSASTGSPQSLTVVIHNVNTRSGKVYVGLANNSATFNGESFQTKAIDVSPSGEITTVFEGLTPGRYAVRVYQDLNSNQKLDFSGQIPSEPFGFSNVAMLMGPPDFDQASFDLKDTKSVRVRMIEL